MTLELSLSEVTKTKSYLNVKLQSLETALSQTKDDTNKVAFVTLIKNQIKELKAITKKIDKSLSAL